MEDQNQKNFYEKIISPTTEKPSCDLCEWGGEEVTAEYQSIKPVKEYAGSSLDSPKKIALCTACYLELSGEELSQELDGRELVKEAANLLRQAPDDVKRDWLEGYIEVYTDDGEEVPPLIELVDSWEENQLDSLGYDFAVKEVMQTIDRIKRDTEPLIKKRGEKNDEDNQN